MITNPLSETGRYICSKEHPMPEKRDSVGQRWLHVDARETAADSDYYIEYRCPNCGHIWRSEMPD
jgi:DNA-directed RNA polymerase subunit M/transcription elongation factor TFIIS